ncbi:MAG: PEP/pyruvate-binding domain-containing protein, partial [Nitrospinota bacterium]
MSKKYVYFFAPGGAEGKADMKNLLGGKGANVAEMTNLGIPVPAGFTISTEACVEYFENNNSYPEGLQEEIKKNLQKLEVDSGKGFGDVENPLLVSVRSGARASMPGMMDTVLNLGLNDKTVQGIIKKTGNARLGYDSYRRFITMFSDVVLEIKKEKFDEVFDAKKKSLHVQLDTELDAGALKEIVSEFKEVVKKEKGFDFPDDPSEQLRLAIEAVFASWNNQRAITYRRMYGIPSSWGTAVNVQSMVFGNMGDTSGTGVAFTRNPSTGERKFYGEFLMNAQGEDVVAGIRTPKPISELETEMPEVYGQLVDIYKKLELHYRDMQDIEFTIEDKKLYMLQTRTGKRTGMAAVRIATDMVAERRITPEQALQRIDAESITQLLSPVFDAAQGDVTVGYWR